MKSNSKQGMVVGPNIADIISAQLKIDRNTFVQAVQLYNTLTGMNGNIAADAAQVEEEVKPRRGRPKGSRNTKTGGKRGPGRPKSKRGPGRPKAKRGPGRPKGSMKKAAGVTRKTVRTGTGGRRGRKPNNANGITLRDAMTKILSGSKGPVGTPSVVEQLQKQGFNSKSLSTQVAQELSRMAKSGVANRVERGQYEWSGSPNAVGAVTTAADSEQSE